MKTKPLIVLAVAAVTLVSAISARAQVTLPDLAEQTVRGAADQNAVINDAGLGTFPVAAVGFLRVKYVNDGNPAGSTANGAVGGDQTSCAKTYFRWSFAGQSNPNTNADLQMTWLNAGNSTASTMTLWSLNQPYPFQTGTNAATSSLGGFTGPGGTNPAVTFANAQANDTNYNPTTLTGTFQMLTTGSFTATPVLPNITPGLGAVTLTIPAPWGNLLHQNAGTNELVFCLGGVLTNQGANGFRIANNSTAIMYNPIVGTNPPFISALTNISLNFNETNSQSFTVADPDGNPARVAQGTVVVSADTTGGTTATVTGSGANQHVNVTAGPNAGGATIEVTIVDENNDEAQRTFTLTVVQALSMSTPANTNTLVSTPVTVNFTVKASSGDNYTVTAAVDPASVNVLSNAVANQVSGSNWTVTVTPLANNNGGTNGVGLVDLSVMDQAGNTAATSFAVIVQATAETVFSDTFNYATGSLLAVSDSIWNEIGPFGPAMKVASGTVTLALQVNGETGEANLLGAPYAPGHGYVIYTTFQANWTTVTAAGNWLSLGEFTNVNAAASLFAAVGNVPDLAGDGGFNATIVNESADVVTTNPATLFAGTTYNIAIRYDVDSAKTTLWINATNEADPNGTNVTATDITTPAQIADITLSQGGAGATVALDALTVTAVIRPHLNSISLVGGNVQIVFTAGVNDTPSSFGLTSTTNLTIQFTAVANPNITSLGGGVFQAKVPVSGNEGFYQVERQPFVFSY